MFTGKNVTLLSLSGPIEKNTRRADKLEGRSIVFRVAEGGIWFLGQVRGGVVYHSSGNVVVNKIVQSILLPNGR